MDKCPLCEAFVYRAAIFRELTEKGDGAFALNDYARAGIFCGSAVFIWIKKGIRAKTLKSNAPFRGKDYPIILSRTEKWLKNGILKINST